MKWLADLGKIQLNRFTKRLSKLQMLIYTWREVSGVIDGEKYEVNLYAPMGGGKATNKKAAEVYQAIGDKYEWKVTRQNLSEVEDALTVGYEEAYKEMPIIDCRISQEENAERNRESEERRIKANAKQAEEDKLRSRFNPDQRLIVIRKVRDDNDIMTDYFNDVTLQRWVLTPTAEKKDKIEVLLNAVKSYPSLTSLNWVEHREKYSMGKGYYIRAELEETVKDYSGQDRGVWYEVKYGTVKYGGENPDWPETPTTPLPSTTTETIQSSEEIEIVKERDWLWVSFPTKPPEAMLTQLKGSGFRWSQRRSKWYKTTSEVPEFLKTAI